MCRLGFRCIFERIDRGHGSCPIDQGPITFEYLNTIREPPEALVQFINKATPLYCPDAKLGCAWIGPWRDLRSHLAQDCAHARFHCPNQCHYRNKNHKRHRNDGNVEIISPKRARLSTGRPCVYPPPAHSGDSSLSVFSFSSPSPASSSSLNEEGLFLRSE